MLNKFWLQSTDIILRPRSIKIPAGVEPDLPASNLWHNILTIKDTMYFQNFMLWHEVLLQRGKRGISSITPKVFGFEITLFYASFILRSLFLSCAIEHPILITEILRSNRNGFAFRKVFGAVPPTETKTSTCNITKMLWAMNQHTELFRSLPLHSDRIEPTQHKFSTYKSCINSLL
jgi:hypothetical protein